MKPMSEVFELPVSMRGFDLQDNNGECVILGRRKHESKHAAHAINSHDLLVDVLQHVANKIENSDEWWMDSPDRGGFDIDRIEAALKQARGE